MSYNNYSPLVDSPSSSSSKGPSLPEKFWWVWVILFFIVLGIMIYFAVKVSKSGGSLAALATSTPILTGRYIRISNPKPGVLNIAEIKVYSDIKDGSLNIAKGKSAFKSGSPTTADMTLTDEDETNYAITGEEGMPWILLDLGVNVPIASIEIINRMDSFQGRMTGSVLEIFDSNATIDPETGIIAEGTVPVFASEPITSTEGMDIRSDDIKDNHKGYKMYTIVPHISKTFNASLPASCPDCGLDVVDANRISAEVLRAAINKAAADATIAKAAADKAVSDAIATGVANTNVCLTNAKNASDTAAAAAGSAATAHRIALDTANTTCTRAVERATADAQAVAATAATLASTTAAEAISAAALNATTIANNACINSTGDAVNKAINDAKALAITAANAADAAKRDAATACTNATNAAVSKATLDAQKAAGIAAVATAQAAQATTDAAVATAKTNTMAEAKVLIEAARAAGETSRIACENAASLAAIAHKEASDKAVISATAAGRLAGEATCTACSAGDPIFVGYVGNEGAFCIGANDPNFCKTNSVPYNLSGADGKFGPTADLAKQRNHMYFAIAGGFGFTFNQLNYGGIISVDDVDDSLPCSDNKSKQCGCNDAGCPLASYGGRRWAVYRRPVTPSWKYVGCWNDDGARIIPEKVGNLTLTQCKAAADAKGYNVIGMQYGKPGQLNPAECFIGNNSDYKRVGEGTTCGVNQRGEGVGDGWMNSVYKLTTQQTVPGPYIPITFTADNTQSQLLYMSVGYDKVFGIGSDKNIYYKTAKPDINTLGTSNWTPHIGASELLEASSMQNSVLYVYNPNQAIWSCLNCNGSWTDFGGVVVLLATNGKMLFGVNGGNGFFQSRAEITHSWVHLGDIANIVKLSANEKTLYVLFKDGSVSSQALDENGAIAGFSLKEVGVTGVINISAKSGTLVCLHNGGIFSIPSKSLYYASNISNLVGFDMNANGDMWAWDPNTRAYYMDSSAMVPPSTISGRYVKLSSTHTSPHCMNIAEIEVYSTIGGANIARGKKAFGSSSYTNDQFPMEKIINGNLWDMAHSSCYDIPSMWVDLGSTVPISKINVNNRYDCCSGRIAGSVLEIFPDGTTFGADGSPSKASVFKSDKFANSDGGIVTSEDNGYPLYIVLPPSTKPITDKYQQLVLNKQVDIDNGGNDLYSVAGADPDACFKVCANDPACSATTFYNGTCWIKSQGLTDLTGLAGATTSKLR